VWLMVMVGSWFCIRATALAVLAWKMRRPGRRSDYVRGNGAARVAAL